MIYNLKAFSSFATFRILLIIGSLITLPTYAAPGAHGPDGEHLDAPGNSINVSGLARLPDGSINIPKIAQRRMSIRTIMASSSEASSTIELPGKVVMDPNASGRVQTVHGGRIEAGPQGLPVAGQEVNHDEVLAYVRYFAEPYAQSVQQAQLADLRSQKQIAKQKVLRFEKLKNTLPYKDLEIARTEAEGLAERERIISNSLDVREVLIAPISGVISTTNLVIGQVVEPRDVLFEVVDPARVLVEASTTDVGLVNNIASAYLEGIANAKLKLLGAARTLRNGVLPLTFSVTDYKKGSALSLAIGQPVTVIVAKKEQIKGFILPAQAIVRNPANEPIVWIKSGAERFIPQPVQFRPLDANTVVITQGLGVDNRVVVQGAPLIAQIR